MVGHFSFLWYVSTELPSTCCCIVFASGFLPVFGLHELDNKIKQIMAALSFTDVTCSCAVCLPCILLTGDFFHFPCQASGWQSLRAAFFFNSVYTAVKCPVLSPLFGDTCRSWIVNLNQLMAKWGLALYYIYVCSPTFVIPVLYRQWLGIVCSRTCCVSRIGYILVCCERWGVNTVSWAS